MQTKNLEWVDEFITRVKPYIFVRTEDNLLIKRPNNAQKLNPVGAKILKALLDGEKISALLKRANNSPEIISDISDFMLAVRESIDGNLDEFSQNPAVEISPFEMNFSNLPVLSELALTYRCNLKCEFCYAGCNCVSNPANDETEMSPREIEKIIEKIYCEAKVPSISFTGGEPTLDENLPRYIRFAKNIGMRVNLITNATLISKSSAEKFAKAGLDSAQVSIEGIRSGTHDKIVNSQGAFDKSIAGFFNLKRAGILTHTNTTITKTNFVEAALFPKFVREILDSDKFSMNLIIPTGSAAVNDKLTVKYSEIGKCLEKIIAESEKYNVEFMWYSPVPMCIFNTITHGLGNKGCGACDGLISVAPNGDVLPCASYDEPVGNLLNENFDEIWQSVNAVKFREKALAHNLCKSCEYFHICNGACPLYWRKIGYEELTHNSHNSHKNDSSPNKKRTGNCSF